MCDTFDMHLAQFTQLLGFYISVIRFEKKTRQSKRQTDKTEANWQDRQRQNDELDK